MEPSDASAMTIRRELAQELIRRACDSGCIGLAAQVDSTTCLILYPDHIQEWCPACLMTAAAEMITKTGTV